MKYFSVVAFIATFIYSAASIFIYCGKYEGFIQEICKNPENRKSVSRYLFSLAVIMLICGFVSLSDSPYSIIFLIISLVSESVILSVIRLKML